MKVKLEPHMQHFNHLFRCRDQNAHENSFEEGTVMCVAPGVRGVGP